MPDGGRAQRPAAVRNAALVAIVLDGGAVLDEGAPRAVVPASAQFRVERIQCVCVQGTNLDLAQVRRDVVPDVAPVKSQCAGGAVKLVEVALQQLIHRGLSPGIPSLFDLADQPVPNSTRLSLSPGSGRDDLD